MLLGQPISGDLDVEAQQGVRHQRRLAHGVKQSDVGRCQERPAGIPGAVEWLGQQPLLFFREHVGHGGIILGDDVVQAGSHWRRRRGQSGLTSIDRGNRGHQQIASRMGA